MHIAYGGGGQLQKPLMRLRILCGCATLLWCVARGTHGHPSAAGCLLGCHEQGGSPTLLLIALFSSCAQQSCFRMHHPTPPPEVPCKLACNHGCHTPAAKQPCLGSSCVHAAANQLPASVPAPCPATVTLCWCAAKVLETCSIVSPDGSAAACRPAPVYSCVRAMPAAGQRGATRGWGMGRGR